MNPADRRLLDEKLQNAKYGSGAMSLDFQAQRQGIQAGLALLPKRIKEVDEATKNLPYPVAGTNHAFLPNLQAIQANTWVKVQEFSLTPPVQGKNNAQLFLTCTGLVRYGGNFGTNFILIRVKVNGFAFPITPIMQTGLSVAGGNYQNQIDVVVELFASDPAGITNDSTAGRENSMRTFTNTVWT